MKSFGCWVSEMYDYNYDYDYVSQKGAESVVAFS
jgi:hypothetical protein